MEKQCMWLFVQLGKCTQYDVGGSGSVCSLLRPPVISEQSTYDLSSTIMQVIYLKLTAALSFCWYSDSVTSFIPTHSLSTFLCFISECWHEQAPGMLFQSFSACTGTGPVSYTDSYVSSARYKKKLAPYSQYGHHHSKCFSNRITSIWRKKTWDAELNASQSWNYLQCPQRPHFHRQQKLHKLSQCFDFCAVSRWLHFVHWLYLLFKKKHPLVFAQCTKVFRNRTHQDPMV